MLAVTLLRYVAVYWYRYHVQYDWGFSINHYIALGPWWLYYCYGGPLWYTFFTWGPKYLLAAMIRFTNEIDYKNALELEN